MAMKGCLGGYWYLGHPLEARILLGLQIKAGCGEITSAKRQIRLGLADIINAAMKFS